MRINTIQEPIFRGFKYTSRPITEISKENLHCCYKTVQAKFFDENVKKVVENNSLLKSLAKDTDIFIHSEIIKYENKFLGILSAAFRDPYNKSKKYADEMSISEECINKQTWPEILKKKLEKLPKDYQTLKDNTNCYCGVRMLRDEGNSTFGYVYEGFLN